MTLPGYNGYHYFIASNIWLKGWRLVKVSDTWKLVNVKQTKPSNRDLLGKAKSLNDQVKRIYS